MDCRSNSWLSKFFAFFTLLPMFSLATETQTIDPIKITQQIYSLLSNKQYDDAFVLAVEKQSQFEGVVEFDLAFGIAARSSGNCNQGIYALERVVQAVPYSIEGRFALANCYYELGNFPAAKSELTILSQLDVSEKLRPVISQAVNSIEKRDNFSFGGWQNSLQINLGMDSNPNNGIEDEFVTVPLLGQVRLFEQSREVSSTFYDLSAQAIYFSPITQQSMWYVSIGAAQTEFPDDMALSRANVNAIGGFKTQLANTDIGTRFFYRPLWLDGTHFLNYFGVITEASMPVLSQSVAGAELTLAKLDYSDQSELTRGQTWLNFWFESATFGGVSRITLKIGDEQSDTAQFDFNSRTLTGLGYSFTQQIDWQWSYKITTDYLKAKYDLVHPLFAEKRDDKLLQIAMNLQYQWLDDWLLTGQISVVNNSSSLTLYEYNRSNLWLGARFQF